MTKVEKYEDTRKKNNAFLIEKSQSKNSQNHQQGVRIKLRPRVNLDWRIDDLQVRQEKPESIFVIKPKTNATDANKE